MDPIEGCLVGGTLVFCPLFFINGAKPDDVIGGALDHQQSGLAVVQKDRHATPFKIERDFVNLLPGAHVNVFVIEDGLVERAF